MSLRRWLSDVLTASRYCQSLEQRIIQERQDFMLRLLEKDARIGELRTELAGIKLESDRMRLVLMPLGSPAGAMYAARFNGVPKPRPDMPEFEAPRLDWQAELNRWEEEDGTRSDGRQEVRSAGSDEGAQQVAGAVKQ